MPDLTRYQDQCLRRAFEEGRHLMLPHGPALLKLTYAGFVTADRVAGVVWIMPALAGIAYLRRHSDVRPFTGEYR